MHEARCLWCGLVMEFKRRTRLKAEMAAHEMSCEASPVVSENHKLHAVNLALTAITQGRRTHLLEQYINPRRRNPEPEVDKEKPTHPIISLAELARGQAEYADCMVYLNRQHPKHCIICGDAEACPMRVETKELTHIGLLCTKCYPKDPTPHKRREMVKKIDAQAEAQLLEMVFMWVDEGRTKMLWGDALTVETIR